MLFNFCFSAKAAECESSIDCMEGKAKCLRRECHCNHYLDYGDGKTKCESKKKNFSNKVISNGLKNVTDQYFSTF